ncbi:MAG: hypothetical protein PHE27_08955, partial [Alphaproteobacteria bacterium]|nr:hypothetical protein [Alphaproteobacteria bacterium]
RRRIEKVRLGFSGSAKTPQLPLDFEDYSSNLEELFIEPSEYSDASTQYVIPPVSHAFDALSQAGLKNIERAEEEAKNYIAEALTRIQNDYGIVVKTCMELEFYALDSVGIKFNRIDVDEAERKLRKSGIAKRFSPENTVDNNGQYELTTSIAPPLKTASSAMNSRLYLLNRSDEIGTCRVSFDPRAFSDCEPSSAHLSFSLWTQNNEPLFVKNGNWSPLSKHIAHGLLEVQKNSVVLSAQTNKAFERFYSSVWAPSSLSASYAGNDGSSLRFATHDDCAYARPIDSAQSVRIENRLPASDSNFFIAMAGTIAGIDYALKKYVTIVDESAPESPDSETHDLISTGSKTLAVKKMAAEQQAAPIPHTLAEALIAFNKGSGGDLTCVPEAQAFFGAVLDMYDLPKEAPAAIANDNEKNAPASAQNRSFKDLLKKLLGRKQIEEAFAESAAETAGQIPLLPEAAEPEIAAPAAHP